MGRQHADIIAAVGCGRPRAVRDGERGPCQLCRVLTGRRFGTMTRVYYRYAIAAVIVFDVSRVRQRSSCRVRMRALTYHNSKARLTQ